MRRSILVSPPTKFDISKPATRQRLATTPATSTHRNL
jgi:hypothetical protein